MYNASALSEIWVQISDTDRLSSGLKAQILARVSRSPANTIWAPADFLDLAASDAVDKAPHQLVRGGGLRRIDRGLYGQAEIQQFDGARHSSCPRAGMGALARRDQNGPDSPYANAETGLPLQLGQLVRY